MWINKLKTNVGWGGYGTDGVWKNDFNSRGWVCYQCYQPAAFPQFHTRAKSKSGTILSEYKWWSSDLWLCYRCQSVTGWLVLNCKSTAWEYDCNCMGITLRKSEENMPKWLYLPFPSVWFHTCSV